MMRRPERFPSKHHPAAEIIPRALVVYQKDEIPLLRNEVVIAKAFQLPQAKTYSIHHSMLLSEKSQSDLKS